jgi:hypothetical protein
LTHPQSGCTLRSAVSKRCTIICHSIPIINRPILLPAG